MSSPYSHLFERSSHTFFDLKGNRCLRYASMLSSIISVGVVISGIYVTKSGLGNINNVPMIALGIIIATVGVIIFAFSSPVWILICCSVGEVHHRPHSRERRLSFISELYALRQAEDGFANLNLDSEEHARETQFVRPPSYQASQESLCQNTEDGERRVVVAPVTTRQPIPIEPPPPYSETDA